jgi:hypothetical protein
MYLLDICEIDDRYFYVDCRIGFTSQLAQQQQQLMAMVQTQSLLAAIQAQASAVAKRGGGGGSQGLHPPSLMQGVRMRENRGRMDNRQNRRMSPTRLNQQRNRNQLNHRQQRSTNFQQQRNWQGNRPNYQQRRDFKRDRTRSSESSRKSEDTEPIEEPYVEEKLGKQSLIFFKCSIYRRVHCEVPKLLLCTTPNRTV